MKVAVFIGLVLVVITHGQEDNGLSAAQRYRKAPKFEGQLHDEKYIEEVRSGFIKVADCEDGCPSKLEKKCEALCEETDFNDCVEYCFKKSKGSTIDSCENRCSPPVALEKRSEQDEGLSAAQRYRKAPKFEGQLHDEKYIEEVRSGFIKVDDCEDNCPSKLEKKCEALCEGADFNDCVKYCFKKSKGSTIDSCENRCSPPVALGKRSEQDDGLSAAQRYRKAPKFEGQLHDEKYIEEVRSGFIKVDDCEDNCPSKLEKNCEALCEGADFNDCVKYCFKKSKGSTIDSCENRCSPPVALGKRSEQDDGLSAAQRYRKAPKFEGQLHDEKYIGEVRSGVIKVDDCEDSCPSKLEKKCEALCVGADFNDCVKYCFKKSKGSTIDSCDNRCSPPVALGKRSEQDDGLSAAQRYRKAPKFEGQLHDEKYIGEVRSGVIKVDDCEDSCPSKLEKKCEALCVGADFNDCVKYCFKKSKGSTIDSCENRCSPPVALEKRSEQDDGLSAAQRYRKAPKFEGQLHDEKYIGEVRSGVIKVDDCEDSCPSELEKKCEALCVGADFNDCVKYCFKKSKGSTIDSCENRCSPPVAVGRRSEQDDGLSATQRYRKAPKFEGQLHDEKYIEEVRSGFIKVDDCEDSCPSKLEKQCEALCEEANFNDCVKYCFKKSKGFTIDSCENRCSPPVVLEKRKVWMSAAKRYRMAPVVEGSLHTDAYVSEASSVDDCKADCPTSLETKCADLCQDVDWSFCPKYCVMKAKDSGVIAKCEAKCNTN